MMPQRLSAGTLLLCFLLLGCGEEDSSPAEDMAEGHEGDSPTATEAAREPAIDVDMREVTYGETETGEPMTGVLAAPTNPDSVVSARGMDPAVDSLPGLVVIHEWWGLNDNVRTATRRLAGEGYRILAVDLYNDSTAQTPEEAQALMKSATSNAEQVLAHLREAHAYFRSEGGAPRVGVLGWCFGGGLTFRAVADRPTAFDAAVAYYGTPEALEGEALKTMTTPILAHFGRQDEVVSTDQVEALQSRLDGLEKDVQIYQYDAGHAFANPSGDRYDSDAASAAWTRTTEFLAEHLWSGGTE